MESFDTITFTLPYSLKKRVCPQCEWRTFLNYSHFHGFPVCIRCRRPRRRRKSNKPIFISENIRNQWLHALSCSKEPLPHIGVPILCHDKELYSLWLSNTIFSLKRTRTEWHSLFNSLYKQPKVYHTPIELAMDHYAILKNPNPFLHKKHIADYVYNLFLLNSCIYSNILKCVQRRLLAKMDKRVVGEEDLYTTAAIPLRSMVAIYDFKTRAKYVFHTNTILKMILSSLKYSIYGIPRPSAPKNPYTNLEWTSPQLLSISQQIMQNMIGLNRLPPPLFISYFKLQFKLDIFAKVCEKELIINSANDLFKMKDDFDTREIYGETFDDMLSELDIHAGYHMRNSIVQRKLPDNLQFEWDNIIMVIWIYTNATVIQHPYTTYDDITDDFKELFARTRKHLYSNRRPRPRTGLIRTYALGDLITITLSENEENIMIM